MTARRDRAGRRGKPPADRSGGPRRSGAKSDQAGARHPPSAGGASGGRYGTAKPGEGGTRRERTADGSDGPRHGRSPAGAGRRGPFEGEPSGLKSAAARAAAAGQVVPSPVPTEARNRRPLSDVGGAVQLRGSSDAEDARVRHAVAHALAVPKQEDATRAHVHGFHSYAARLHPETAARLIEALSRPGDRVLDPFCGSGTVVAEAHRLGRRAVGFDANPLAVALTRLKVEPFSEQELASLLDASEFVAEQANERRLSKAGPTKRYGPADRELFDIHVLLELDGLQAAIRSVSSPKLQRALELVLSSLLTKVSRQPGDTVRRLAPRRLAGGFTIRLFQDKTRELVERLQAFATLRAEESPRAEVQVGDARRVHASRLRGVRLIVTSPPYPGVYDYALQHKVRLRWLGLDGRSFERSELGARRQYARQSYEDALALWRHDFGQCLSSFRRVLVPGGHAALVLADAVIGGRALAIDEAVSELAEANRFRVVVVGSQKRQHVHGPTRDAFGRRPRREHLIVLAPKVRRKS